MKKKLLYIFVIAFFTATGIILFQAYWLYNAYQVSRENFLKTATLSLQNSVDTYQLKQDTFFAKSQPVDKSVVFWYDPTYPINMGAPKPSLNKDTAVNLSTANLTAVQLMMSKLLSQTKGNQANMAMVRKLYRAQLNKNNILQPFRLSLLPKKPLKHLPEVWVSLGLSDSSPIIVATFTDGYNFLFRQNIVSVIVSLTLILLSGGCLWYMWSVIRQQIKLDDIKNNFINNMTHELKTPVSVLQSTHEALDTFGEIADTEKSLRYIRINRNVLTQLENNIDRILDITKFEKENHLANLEDVNLEKLLEEIIYRYSLHSDATIALDYKLNGPVVNTDKYMIETVTGNLIENAIKYNATHPKITIGVSGYSKGWQLKINDNGKGIEKKYLPYIFDKFYRVPTGNVHDIKGFGLGLNYVKQLINHLGGTITVTSIPGNGTCFTILFPVIWKR